MSVTEENISFHVNYIFIKIDNILIHVPVIVPTDLKTTIHSSQPGTYALSNLHRYF
jgi:hypothetical protein